MRAADWERAICKVGPPSPLRSRTPGSDVAAGDGGLGSDRGPASDRAGAAGAFGLVTDSMLTPLMRRLPAKACASRSVTVRLPVPGSPSPSFPSRRKRAIFALPTLTDRFEEQRVPKDSLTVTDNRTGKTYELAIADGTIKAMDLASDQGQ
jgi:hypothetical protein